MSTRYLQIMAIQELMDLGNDARRRRLVGFNVECLCTPPLSLLDDLATLLVQANVGVYNAGIEDSTIFTSSAASVPNGDGPYLVIRETGGPGASRIQNNTSGYSRPSAQITVHALLYADARAMAKAARDVLDGTRNVTVN